MDEFYKVLAEELGQEEVKGESRSLREVKREFFHRFNLGQTPIQRAAIEPVFAGKNALLVSATASGKTEAVVVPIVARLTEGGRQHLCVYLAPTKALLNDLVWRLGGQLDHLNFSYAIRHGDRPLPDSDKPFNLLFTTPESLDVMLCKNEPFLSRTRVAVIDEVHQLFGNQRGQQVLFLLERLKRKAQCPLQRLALSATVADPPMMANWLSGSDSPLEVFSVGSPRAIDARVHWADNDTDLARLILATKSEKLLLFTNSRRQCEETYLALRGLDNYDVLVHYSTLEKEDREFVERRFKQARSAICIATTTLELGIDIGSVETVVLRNPPWSVNSLIQRIGRGGRRQEVALALMAAHSPREFLQLVAQMSLVMKEKLEPVTPAEFHSVVIQQILSYTASKSHHRISEEEIISLCQPWQWITVEDIASILSFLSRLGFLHYDPKWQIYEMGTALESLYNDAQIYSNIAGTEGGIEVRTSSRRLAFLPLPRNLHVGDVILFQGRYWKVRTSTKGRIHVEPIEPVSNPIIPTWRGAGPAVSDIIAEEARYALCSRELPQNMQLDRRSERAWDSLLRGLPEEAENIDIWLEKCGNIFVYYTFAGHLVNLMLCLLFNGIDSRFGPVLSFDEIALLANSPLDWSAISKDPQDVLALMSANWRQLREYVSTTDWYDLLPLALKKREVLSQFALPELAARVNQYKDAEMVEVKLGLYQAYQR